MKQMINFKATATVQTDEGVFEAVISTQAVDRENDIVHPEAMVDGDEGVEPADPAGVAPLHQGRRTSSGR